jgi:peptide/nickel transport system permease protein
LKRIVYSFITIFVVIFVVFTISRSAGDPVTAYITAETPAKVVEIIREKYHLNDPIPVQFVYWVKGLLQGDWGRAHSFTREPVLELIIQYLPKTIELNLYVFAIALPLSYWIGTIAATKKDTYVDHFTRLLAIIGTCFPQFFIGILIMAFLYPRGWMVMNPNWTFQRITGMPTVDALLNGDLFGFVQAFKFLIGPLLTAVIASISMQARVLRSSILEELNKDYITTGKAKGLSTDYVEKKYARRNALIPYVTLMGLWVANITSGSAILEVVFNRHGIGNIIADAARATDHNTVQAFTMIYTIILVMSNLIIDIVYGFIDPRITYGEKQ